MKNEETNELYDVFKLKCKGLKWKEEFVYNLCTTSNYDLLESTINSQIPDDWDGMMSPRGRWEADISLEILKQKLKNDGWLV